MEAAFEEEPQQPTFTGTTDAPATKEAAAESFFDDDGFGDFEDAAWETPVESISEESTLPQNTEHFPPAAPAAFPTTAGSKKDILSLDPAAFLDAATTTMARYSPLHKGAGTNKRDKRSNNSSIHTLKDLINKFPYLRQKVSVASSRSSSSSITWEGSISQTRLLHRLNLGPAPVVSSALLTQPPLTRAGNLRPSSSKNSSLGSLYGSTASFPAPPGKQQRSVLAPPPPQQTKNIEAVLEKDIDPTKADPFASSGSADLVDLVQPAEVPGVSAQPLTNGLGELTLSEPAQALVEPVAIEEQIREKEEDKEEMQLDNSNEHADSSFLFTANPSEEAPYQNPFMEETPPREEGNRVVALVTEEQVDTQEADPYNPFIVAGQGNKDLTGEEVIKSEENDHEGFSVEVATGVVEKEVREEVMGTEVENMIEKTVEDEDSFDAFEEAPRAAVVAASAAAVAAAVISSNEESDNSFKVAEEDTREEETMVYVEEQHNDQAVEEDVMIEEEAEIEKLNFKESREDTDEFEWAEAASPSVHTMCSTEIVEDIDVSYGTHRAAATPVVKVVEEREEEHVIVLGAVPENGDEIINEIEEQEGPGVISSITENSIEEEEDDFDDFCEADEAPEGGQEEEKEKKAVVVPTAAERAEDLAATVPDLSFMLSNSLIKPSP